MDVQWDGFGERTTSRFHEMFADPFGSFNDHFTSTLRSADAAGRLDGIIVEDSSLFPSTLRSSRASSISRFSPFATSPATAVAAAAAAAVAHTTEASASAALTTCPPAAPVGTTCDGMLVGAFALGGRVGHEPIDEGTVSVSLFELTVTAGGLVPRFVGAGSDEAAAFRVEADLTGATAEAEIALERCDPLGCTVDRTVAVSVDWVGQGDTRAFRFHSQFRFDGQRGNTVGSGASREAVAVGALDGTPFTGVPPFAASIQQVTIHTTTT